MPAAGTKLGPYEILGPLGAGGMGEVFRAKDTRLDRQVAIKVLPLHLADNLEAKQRFDREARAISLLSHPNICMLYDVGHQDGTDYLVMELLEGETLAQRLKKGAMSLEPLLKTGMEICDGLATAHRAGIVHRDLKPGNIMLTKAGAKLMDFGLAKAGQTSASATELTMTAAAPSGEEPLTAHGSVIGTFQYMAPEQVEGRPADARSDIFSLGAVLYEMATGKRAFDGKTAASVMAAVLEREPVSISSVNPMSPPALERVVKTCLAKDPDDRFQTARDLKLQLKWIAEGAATSAMPVGMPRPSAKMRSGMLAWVVAGLLAVVALGLGAWVLMGKFRSPTGVVFATIPAPAEARYLPFGFGGGPVVVSPDGSTLAFSAIDHDGTVKLWTRALNSREGSATAGTENAAAPFWSPDGKSIGFFADGKLKTVNLANGAIQVVAQLSGINLPEGDWGSDGTILYYEANRRPLMQVPAMGGTPKQVAGMNPKDGTFFHPRFLPGGHYFLCGAINSDTGRSLRRVGLDGSQPETVLKDVTRAEYASGYLLFVRDGKLYAQRYDPQANKLSGDEIALLDAANFSASQNGVIAYSAGLKEMRARWYDRAGNTLGSVGPVAEYASIRLSPDRKHVLAKITDPRDASIEDLWSLPVTGGEGARLTYGPGNKGWPIWSADGKYIAYSAGNVLYRSRSDGSKSEERLYEAEGESSIAAAVDWSPDGKYVSYDVVNAKSAVFENWVVPLTGDKKPFRTSPGDASQFDGNFSPDGKWIAYFSYETGRPEVFVAPFPGPGGKYQISHDGGWLVRWSHKNQLFFVSTGDRLMEADLDLNGSHLEVKALKTLFPLDLGGRNAPLFDVTPDGERFLAITPARAGSDAIGLVLNWTELVGKK